MGLDPLNQERASEAILESFKNHKAVTKEDVYKAWVKTEYTSTPLSNSLQRVTIRRISTPLPLVFIIADIAIFTSEYVWWAADQ